MRLTFLGMHEPVGSKVPWKADMIYAAEKVLGWHVEAFDERSVNETKLLRSIRRNDFFLYVRTIGIDPGVNLDKCWIQNTPSAVYSPDRWFSIRSREPEIGKTAYWRAPIVFGNSGFPDHIQRYKEFGINYRFVPTACGDNYIGAGTFRPELRCKVAITARHRRKRPVEYRLARDKLMDALEDKFGDEFHWYGPKTRRGSLWGKDLQDLSASAQVIIGDQPEPPLAYCWSNRIPMTLGARGLLVQSAIEGLEDYGYVHDRTLMLYPFGDNVQMIEVVEEALALEEVRRNRIVDAGVALVKEKHSWSKRLEVMYGMASI